MNYHIMIDDKFIDRFIDDAENVSNLNSNVYFVRGEKERSKFVFNEKVIWISLNDSKFINILKNLYSTDKVIVHWYDLEIGKLLLENLPKDISLYVALWGGEFYEDPYLYHMNWIHDPLTLQFVEKEYIIKEKYRFKLKYFFKRFWIKSTYKKKASRDYEIKKKTIERINKLLLPIHDEFEIDCIKKLYDLDQLDFMHFNYDLNVDYSEYLNEKVLNSQIKDNIRIQIGNSATESNNHVDAFEVIKNFKDNTIQIFLPLSYGNKKYANFVKDYGDNLFGSKIEYDEVFLSREEYIEKLKNTDICIMFHNRQQAFGNCIPLLMLGKKIFIKKNNPIYQLFRRIGVVVFDADTIRDLTFIEFSKPLTVIEKENNKRIVKDLFSQSTRLEYLKKILN